jgi:hypothetical protein
MDVARWLAWAGPGDEPGWRPNLAAFRRLLLTHMAVRTFLLMPPGAAGGVEPLLRATTVLVGLVGLVPGAGLGAARLAVPLIAGEIVWTQLTRRDSANHVAVELFCLALLALFDERDEREARLLLPGLRWFIALLLFYTGLQKLLYGYYFQGQFLAFMAGTEERFAAFFRHFMPAGELERLQSYNELVGGRWRPRIGAGPYIVRSSAFQILSNAVYLFEMAAGVALCVPRLRTAAALAAIAFVVLIEAGARELTFGLLMANLLLLFVRGGWNRRLYWALTAGYLYLVAHKLFPEAVPLIPYSPA